MTDWNPISRVAGRVPTAPGSREPSPDGLGPAGFDPSRKSDLGEAYEIVGEMLESFDKYTLATWAPLAAIILRERRETITRFLRREIDINGSVEPIKPALHLYNPHRKWPWFCADCGYPEHERLKHPPRDSDGNPKGQDAVERLGAEHDSAGRKASPGKCQP